MTDRLLIYGANGATGRRLAELALADGLTPVLAGRDADRITRLADRLGGEARVAPIDQLAGIVTDVRVIASCVAPYTAYGRPVAQAALRAGAHYLDLTGEPRFVRWLLDTCDGPARDRGVTLVPSAGLGLCSGLAARAAVEALPGPVERITVGYRPRGMRPSAGTVHSTVEIIAGGAVTITAGQARLIRSGRGLRRTPAGLGALFPLTDPLTLHTVWPDAGISGYVVPPAAPLLVAPTAAAMALLPLGSASAKRRVLSVSRRLFPGAHPGGGFRIGVRAHDRDGATRDAVIDLDDVYELTSRAALEVARSLMAASLPGVRAAISVVDSSPEVLDRIGARLDTTG
jgi:hypothetical protein